MEYEASEWITAVGNALASDCITLLTEPPEEFIEVASVTYKTLEPDPSFFTRRIDARRRGGKEINQAYLAVIDCGDMYTISLSLAL